MPRRWRRSSRAPGSTGWRCGSTPAPRSCGGPCREFAGLAADADVAVVFYAGHGIEVGQANYLIPVDARLVTDYDVEDEAVPLDRVLQAMEPAKRLRVVILDACRENPFAKSIKRTVAGRSVGRGLGRIEPSAANTLIAFATKPNAIAEDGKGPNSPFTAALVKHLITPGLDLRIALGRVRDEVLAGTASRQEPYVTGSLGGSTVSIVGDAPKPAVPRPCCRSRARPPSGRGRPPRTAPASRCWRRSAGSTGPPTRSTTGLPRRGSRSCARQQTAMLKAEPDRKRRSRRPAAAGPRVPRLRRCLPGDGGATGRGVHDGVANGEAATARRPQHKVTIARPFAVGKFEVTFAEWDACVADGGCKPPARAIEAGAGAAGRCINVSWHDAKEYAAWLSRKTGKTYRLLSEAEWEYAARAGTTTRYAFGDTISKSQAQYSDRRAGPAGGRLVPRQQVRAP